MSSRHSLASTPALGSPSRLRSAYKGSDAMLISGAKEKTIAAELKAVLTPAMKVGAAG